MRTPPSEEADPKFDELTKCHLSSLQRLATAILSVSHQFMADARPEVEKLGSVEALTEFRPVKQGNR